MISLILPCYNEEANVPRLIAALESSVNDLGSRKLQVEVVIVDDGSRDKTAELLRAATAGRSWLRVYRFARNFGQTAAMSAAFTYARGDVIVALDSDLQNDPADIPLLLAKIDEGFDVVSGWRKNRKDKALTRILPSVVANRLISWLSGVRLHDYGCTLKAYRSDVIAGVHLYGEMHRLIPIYAAWHGARVTEVVVTHHPRTAGVTKYGLGRIPNVILDVLLARFLWSYGTKPSHLFGKFGLLNIAASLLCFASMIWFKFLAAGHKDFVETPLPLLCVTFFLIGCQSILLGFLAEISIRTYHEAADSPTYVIREEYRDGSVSKPARLEMKSGGGV